MEKNVASKTCTEESENSPTEPEEPTEQTEEQQKEKTPASMALSLMAIRKSLRAYISKTLCSRIAVAAKDGHLLSIEAVMESVMDTIAELINDHPEINQTAWSAIKN